MNSSNIKKEEVEKLLEKHNAKAEVKSINGDVSILVYKDNESLMKLKAICTLYGFKYIIFKNKKEIYAYISNVDLNS